MSMAKKSCNEIPKANFATTTKHSVSRRTGTLCLHHSVCYLLWLNDISPHC